MNQGGINNAALIGASQRQARNKLDMMAGIQRPQGILASSPQLMQAAMSPMQGQAPMPMSPPPMMPAAPVQRQAPVMPSLPQLPMNTAVTPMPRSPAVPRPDSPATPMKFAPGTAVDMREDFSPKFQRDVPASAIPRFGRGADRVDITKEATPLLFSMDAELQKQAIDKFGSVVAAEKAANEKGNTLASAIEASKDPAKVAGAVLDAAEVPNTDEGKKDFAQNVLGIDTNDIGEIDEAIFKVLTSKSDATGEEFQQAVLLGLQGYKQTIAARSAAASGTGGEKSRQEYLYKSVFDATYKAALDNFDDPEDALAAARQAAITAAPNAPSATMGGQNTAPAAPPADISSHQAANDAAKQAGEKIYTINGEQFNVQ